MFARASEVLGFDLLKLCADGPAERLTRTDVCQPAILVTSGYRIVALETFEMFPHTSHVETVVALEPPARKK